jgi:tRNA threonylcarbamoyladenosine biosynthesis protein TsaB
MRILAFDTATRGTAVAVADVGGDAVPERSAERYHAAPHAGPPGHAVDLLDGVEEVLAELGGGWKSFDAIAVGVGPGTFTGLRIGVASAQALACSRGLPLVAVSSLHALGLGAAGPLKAKLGSAPLLALIDARRGEAFAAGWPASAQLLEMPSSPVPSVLPPERLRAHVSRGSLAIGDGAIKFRVVLEKFGAVVPADDDPVHQISAVSHCRLAATLPPSQRLQDVEPAYLRIPDAEIASAGR